MSGRLAGGEVQNRSGDRSRGSVHAPSLRRAHAVARAIPRGGTGQLLFPRHKVGIGGKDRVPMIWDVQLDQPMGEWKKTWDRVRTAAKLDYRWHYFGIPSSRGLPRIQT